VDLFSEPGRRLAFDSVWLGKWHSTFGRLYLQLPGGITKPDYELLITLPDSRVTIPFTI
jgi:hypothetical protein